MVWYWCRRAAGRTIPAAAARLGHRLPVSVARRGADRPDSLPDCQRALLTAARLRCARGDPARRRPGAAVLLSARLE